MKKVLFLGIFLTIITIGTQFVNAAPHSAIAPGAIRTDASYNHIGVVWQVTGDTNQNSQMSLEFRKQGESDWQDGAMAMRAYPTLIVNGGALGKNYWAASALFLQEDTTYELRLSITDPDGGNQTQTVSATTRSWPQPDATGRQLYVVPGNGGGDGSFGNPFKGLQAAADAAQAGDWFHVAAGSYSAFELTADGTEDHPIAFEGPEDKTAVIDGGDTDRGVVTLASSNHVILQGFTIQNGYWGIDAQHTQNIYIHHNTIQDVGFGIYNRRQNGTELNQTVCDNVLTGRTTWPNTGIPSERGIDLRGTGNVVCHNTVRNFGDCISVQPIYNDSYSLDIYGNDASYCVDDGIEIDYNMANTRVWRNRVMNARMGVSVQPIAGGPAYIFRNELFNLESQPLKMNNRPSGYIFVHNTAVKHGNGLSDPSESWRNAYFRNNLMLGNRYAFEFVTTANDGFRDFDYNAWGTTRAGEAGTEWFKWDNVRYKRIVDLPAGVEDHGVEASFDDLVNATLSADWDVAVTPGSRDLRLNAGKPEIDAGATLANLNDAFTLNGAPDMGAFEFGEPLPSYGIRPLSANFTSSSKTVSHGTPQNGDTVTFTITLQNTGTDYNEAVNMIDNLPSELSYNTSTLSATSGTIDDSIPSSLKWSGTPGSEQTIVITYEATVNSTMSKAITNTAVFDTGTLGTISPTTTLIINPRSVFLPTILK